MVLKGVAMVGATLGAFVSCGHETKMAKYQDARDGWTISYPASMRRTVVDYQARVSMQGVVIANSDQVRTSEGVLFRRFPPDGAAVGLIQQGGGPMPDLSPPEARFPLSRSSFTPVRGAPSPRPLIHGMIANGSPWLVAVWFGPKASRRDREEIWKIVESIRFPKQRTGTMSGDFYVLEDASRYPLGSVVQFAGKNLPERSSYVPPFFLVHAPGGLYTVSWQPRFEPKCHMAFDRSRYEFYCTTHKGRWNRMGEVIERPESDLQYNDSLDLGQAKIGRDGQVLVGNWRTPGSYGSYERQFWPGLKRRG
jgi:hypothetical protein